MSYRALGLLILLVWSGASLQAEDGLFYAVEGERLVFTNMPAGNMRAVPGTAPQPRTRRGLLPATIYDPFIEKVARENGLPPELLKAVALVESGFNPHAVSPKGAQGLMQLMPSTARHYGVRDAFDPLQNLRAGATHLRGLLDSFDGNLNLALAAYNAGPGAVRRHGGVPAYKETRAYVRKVHQKLGTTAQIEEPSGRGRRPAAAPPPKEVKMVRRRDGSVLLVN